MRYAIVSDIHANAEALKRVLDDASEHGANTIVCLGDVVGYGPRPAQTIALLSAAHAVVIAGNHDDAVSGRADAASFVDLAAEAVQRHREILSHDALDYLSHLPYTVNIDGALGVHGDFLLPEDFNYIDSVDAAVENFAATEQQLLFVGHTHIPMLYVIGTSGVVHQLPPQDFTLEADKRYIVNPGSVGYPRETNGTCYSTYVLYDSAAKTILFRQLPFSVASVMQRGVGCPITKDVFNVSVRIFFGLLIVIFCLFLVGMVVYFLFGRAVMPRNDLKSHDSIPVVVSPGEEVQSSKPLCLALIDAIDPSLVVTQKILRFCASDRSVRANLKLKRGTDPVQLTILFKNAQGMSFATPLNLPMVKGQSTKAWEIPQGAVSAHFIVLKHAQDDIPKIISFTPRSYPASLRSECHSSRIRVSNADSDRAGSVANPE